MKKIILLLAVFAPQPVKFFIYRKMMGWDIGSNVKIGYSLIVADHVSMEKGSQIGHFNVIKNITLKMEDNASIASLNWITGFPKGGKSKHFSHLLDRSPELKIGHDSAITSRHLIDCTSSVKIGHHSTFAGYRSQILTHAIDLYECRQDSSPVEIGNYCFVGTGSIFLPGSSIGNYCIVGAASLINAPNILEAKLYAGVPARPIKSLDINAVKYMTRDSGYVW